MRVEMIYSWVNATAIREEMNQFSSINRFLISANKEYQSLLTDEEQVADSEWYDQFDEVFSFKHKMFKWLKEAELNNEEMKSRMSFNSVSLGSSKSENSRGSKVSMEERTTEQYIRIAEKIAESNYADQKMKIEYNRKKLEIEEKVAKAKTRAKVLSTLGNVSLQKYKKKGLLLTGADNSKNKKIPLLRKDPIFDKNENKVEDQKFSHQSRLNIVARSSLLLRNT